nr:amino acid racemase [Saprospiraceae bacterium]
MNKIGIIAGIGPASTIEYYNFIIQGFRERLSTKDYPEMLLHSINMTEMLDYVFKGELDELVGFLKEKVQVLEETGVDYVALASNTPHLVFDKLAEAVDVPMISIVEETCQIIAESKLTKVGLLGTKSTMSMGFYQRVGAKQGIEIVIPGEKQQDYVHEKYMGELVFNEIKAETKQRLIGIVDKLQEEENIEGIILGGTELPLILKQEDFHSLKVFNT